MIWKQTAVILLVLTFVLTGLLIQENRYKAALVRDHALERAQLEVKLSKWIYTHSERISRNTCDEIAREVAKTKNPKLVLALIELESMKFTPGALSKAGAIGWCQVMYEDNTGKDVHGKALIKAGIIKEKRDLWDTAPNIRAGAFIFEMKLAEQKGDVQKALIAYNGGKTPETPVYLLRILSNFADLSVNP